MKTKTIALFILLMILGIVLTIMFALPSDACVVGRTQIYNTKYVYHDLDCDGTVDMVYEYYWNGRSFVFTGSYPYDASE